MSGYEDLPVIVGRPEPAISPFVVKAAAADLDAAGVQVKLVDRKAEWEELFGNTSNAGRSRRDRRKAGGGV